MGRPVHVRAGGVMVAAGALAIAAVLAHCTSADRPRSTATSETVGRGTIRGSVTARGGPAPGATLPVHSGTLHVVGEGVDESHALAGDGTFTVAVPSGEFRVYANVPQDNNGAECWPVEDGEAVSGGTVRVSRSQVTEIRIVCPIR